MKLTIRKKRLRKLGPIKYLSFLFISDLLFTFSDHLTVVYHLHFCKFISTIYIYHYTALIYKYYFVNKNIKFHLYIFLTKPIEL